MPESKKSISEQYELGDAGHDPAVDEPALPVVAPAEAPPGRFPAPAAAPSSTDEGASRGPQRPRNPDGTFAPSGAEKPSPSGHNRQTLRLAREFGLSEQEIEETPPSVLDDVVYHLFRQQRDSGRDHSRQEILQSGSTRREQSSPAPVEPPAPEEGLGLDEEAYDPGLLGVLKAQARQLRQLEEQLASVQSYQRQQVNLTITQQCDQAFERHKALLGEGTGSSLRPDDPHFLRRKAVLGLVDSMPAGGSLQSKIDRAVGILFGVAAANPQEAARGGGPVTGGPPPSSSREEDWKNGTLARPTQRGSSEPPGERKAMQTAGRIMREQGMITEDDLPEDAFLD